MEDLNNLKKSNQGNIQPSNITISSKTRYWLKSSIVGFAVGILVCIVGAFMVSNHESQLSHSEVSGLGSGLYVTAAPFIVLSVMFLFLIVGIILDMVAYFEKK